MTTNSFQPLTLADVAALFGGDAEEIRRWCAPYLEQHDFAYRPFTPEERDAALLDSLKKLDPQVLSAAGPERHGAWESGWSENLREFVEEGYRLDSLIPKYVRPNNCLRLLGQYVQPRDPWFERSYIKMFRAWLVAKYITDGEAFYEFGCGPGSHVAYLAQTFPGRPVFGLDWAEASVKIMEAMATHYGWPVTGRRFDFFAPDRDFRLLPGSVVLTFGALEQIGTRHAPFLDFLLANAPRRCVHAEVMEELYDDSNLLDALALRYHRQRNYLSGFLPRLRELEQEKRLIIEAVHHHRLGNRYNDTFSYVVWRPA